MGGGGGSWARIARKLYDFDLVKLAPLAGTSTHGPDKGVGLLRRTGSPGTQVSYGAPAPVSLPFVVPFCAEVASPG
jgi:hypothetical protein